MNGAHSDWMEELEEILDEHISEKLGKIRKDVLKDMGPIGLLMHTRLNRISSSTFIETTSLTDEEKEIIDSPEQLRMHPIPNNRGNFIWFLCNRMINIISSLKKFGTI